MWGRLAACGRLAIGHFMFLLQQNHAIMFSPAQIMTKRILLIFCLLAAMILPAAAATKARHSKSGKQSLARSGRTKAKSVRKSTHRRTRSAASRKRAARARASARRQKLARK
jgi:hypothetical protein